jgi:hypothetical protein
MDSGFTRNQIIKGEKEMNLPTPKTAVGKMCLRVILVGVIAGLGYALQQPEVVSGGMAYVVLKTIYDLLNTNVPNA